MIRPFVVRSRAEREIQSAREWDESQHPGLGDEFFFPNQLRSSIAMSGGQSFLDFRMPSSMWPDSRASPYWPFSINRAIRRHGRVARGFEVSGFDPVSADQVLSRERLHVALRRAQPSATEPPRSVVRSPQRTLSRTIQHVTVGDPDHHPHRQPSPRQPLPPDRSGCGVARTLSHHGQRSSAVLVSEEDWKAIQETMYLLSIPGMRESIRPAMAEPLTKSAKALKW